ncbi:MAG TPA: prepilin peptidase [Methylomirabilota bacterium]|nr:prepilin peptidase [Methylomirabilota bacterium]
MGVALVLGAVVGSFLNVVVVRIPRGQSLVRPPSHCGVCGKPIRWFDNIPLLSFLWLRGRCRLCQTRISWRYPVIEATTAILFALAAPRVGWGVELVGAWLFVAVLVAIAAIDLEHQVIPDSISLPAIAAGLALSFVTPSRVWVDSLLGITVGAGIPFAVIILSRGGMGGGDMRLGALIGAFLGWQLALLSLFMAVLLGGVVATALLVAGRKGRKDRIPFGPFLAGSGVICLLWGNALLGWYWSSFTP